MSITQEKDYLHAYHESSLGQIEAERLRLFNTAYAPKAHEILNPYFETSSPLHVLELGVGTGAMGGWLAQKSAPSGSYLGIDKDIAQLEKASQVITETHAKLLKIDLLNAVDFELLVAAKPEKGFDLIYCRWVLCHIQKQHLPSLIQRTLSLLSSDGSFICEEPDYHSMELRVQKAPTADHAISTWKKMVKNLQNKPNLGLDLEMNANKLLELFNTVITDKANHHYSVEILGQSEPELIGDKKYALVFGLKTAKEAILSTGMSKQEFDELYKKFEEIAENPNKSVVYYTNTFARVTTSHFS
jgi:predicted O-methyltransferase YrrM